MTWPELELGDSLTGLLIDGIRETPYVGATLKVADSGGVLVEIPYLSRHEAPQFANVNEWFSEKSPPTNMIMRTPEGTLTMFDVAWSGHSENWGGGQASLGKLRPHEVVLARREGPLDEPLTISEMHSYVDGLSRWTRARAIATESETDVENKVQSVTIRMTGGTFLQWQQGDTLMELRSHWTHSPTSDGLASVTTLHDSVTLVSRFSSGSMPFWEHFVEQRKLANLLTFVFGNSISFRRHQIRDERFPARLGGNGDVYDLPLRELLSRNTFRERTRPVPTTDELGEPLVPFVAIGDEGLAAWSRKYKTWSRFIVPSLGVLSRQEAFIEDFVLSTSLSLEAAGLLLGVKGEEETTYWRRKPTTATYAYRCLHEIGQVWPARIESVVGLARAIANNYNDLKHADRGEFPDQVHSYLVSRVSQLVVRALALNLTGPSAELRGFIQQSAEMSRISEAFAVNHLSITDDGQWQEDPDPTAGPPLPAGLTLG